MFSSCYFSVLFDIWGVEGGWSAFGGGGGCDDRVRNWGWPGGMFVGEVRGFLGGVVAVAGLGPLWSPGASGEVWVSLFFFPS